MVAVTYLVSAHELTAVLSINAGCAELGPFFPIFFMLTSVCWTSKCNLSKPQSHITYRTLK